MKSGNAIKLLAGLAPSFFLQPKSESSPKQTGIDLPSAHVSGVLRLAGFYYETAAGRVSLPVGRKATAQGQASEWQSRMSDGRKVSVSVLPEKNNYTLRLIAQPAAGIIKWGFGIDSKKGEYFTGLMERVVDGPQQNSWAQGIREAMNLRGLKVDMLVKPTTSVDAPFYLSSRGYGQFAKTNWPGHYDFCALDPRQVKIEFEGPALQIKVYTASASSTIVAAHALDAGPPFLPPKWMFNPWRWRDEHTQGTTYYEGTR